MEPVMLVETLDTHGRLQTRQRFRGAGTTCKIGRGLDCDVILDDGYAAAEHSELRLQDDGRVAIRDLGSRNGTRLNGHRLGIDTTIAVEDGVLIIGRSRVRVRTALSSLPAEILFRRDLLQRYRTILAIVGVVLVVGYAVFDQWLRAPEDMAPRLTIAAMIAIGVITLWSGVWALIARVVHGAWNLRTHVAIAGIALAACVWTIWLMDVVSYATQWRWIAPIAKIGAVIIALSALYLHLRKAAFITRRTALIVATVLPLTLGGVGLWITRQDEVHDVNRMVLGMPVHPPSLRLAQSEELDHYLTRINALRRTANQQRQQSLVDAPIAEPDTAQ